MVRKINAQEFESIAKASETAVVDFSATAGQLSAWIESNL